jgi:hypothetical protein
MVSENDNSSRLGKLAVIVLTYNEEANIAQALDSVSGWANKFSSSILLAQIGRWRLHVTMVATLHRTGLKTTRSNAILRSAIY